VHTGHSQTRVTLSSSFLARGPPFIGCTPLLI